MERTYSQKVARVFELVCYVLLIPTVFSLFYPALIVIGGLVSGRADAAFFGLIPFIIAGVGVVLLIGYHKHADDRLDEKHISGLWIGTAVYNLLLLLPCLLMLASHLKIRYEFIYTKDRTGFLILASIASAYIAAIYFSLKAYLFEKRKNLFEFR